MSPLWLRCLSGDRAVGSGFCEHGCRGDIQSAEGTLVTLFPDLEVTRVGWIGIVDIVTLEWGPNAT